MLNGADPPLDETTRTAGLLGPEEPPVFELVNEDGATPLLIVCDHASNRIPAALDTLGLEAEVLEHHIAYDIGAAAVTRQLAERLDAPALLSNYSRLVVDLNRQPGDPQAIPYMSDGVLIPGNQDLSDDDLDRRIEVFHEPYHHALSVCLAHIWRRGVAPWLFSVHSFTPRLLGQEERKWDTGVLWNRDPRLAMQLIQRLREAGYHVGDNEPYSGKQIAYTIDRHAGGAGLPHCAVEIRQDLLKTPGGQTEWAALLGDALAGMLDMDSLHGVRHY